MLYGCTHMATVGVKVLMLVATGICRNYKLCRFFLAIAEVDIFGSC